MDTYTCSIIMYIYEMVYYFIFYTWMYNLYLIFIFLQHLHHVFAQLTTLQWAVNTENLTNMQG